MQAVIETSLGPIKLIEQDNVITEIIFNADEEPSMSDSPVIRQCISELEEYFKGERTSFDVPIKIAGTEFQNKVWNELTKIPYGQTISYSELAFRLGDIKTIRAAASANGKNKLPIIVPCHRVIGKDGSLVGFSGGLDKKELLLKLEGVIRDEQLSLF
ncbi:MAG: methylated-DNA--[protein]-cysteine S-methyltransferase [Bacteroidota bacterium]